MSTVQEMIRTGVDNALFDIFAEADEQKKLADYNDALAHLAVHNECRKFYSAIKNAAETLPLAYFPYLTEAIYRYLFKIKIPEDPANKIGYIENPAIASLDDGANTRRMRALAKELAGFHWGKLIGHHLISLISRIFVTKPEKPCKTGSFFGGLFSSSTSLRVISLEVAPLFDGLPQKREKEEEEEELQYDTPDDSEASDFRSPHRRV